MTLFLVSFIAGVLTALAPCVLPLLPVIIGSSVGARSKTTPVVVILSLVTSILLFTYLLKASTALISIPPAVWTYVSGGILLGFGLVLLFPALWERLPLLGQASVRSNKLLGAGHQKKSIWGDVMVGAALGPVFSTCSPTYFVILATVLPVNFFLGTAYLLAYLAGLALVLGLIAFFGQRLTDKLQIAADSRSLFKKGIGILFILVGLFIMTGLDKQLETAVLNSGYFDITQVEQKILDTVSSGTKSDTTSANNSQLNMNETIPNHLLRQFPKTDFTLTDPSIENVLSGGPGKDGIPALDAPIFVALTEVDYQDSVQAIVLTADNETKVYPYSILVWHEIVNDTFNGTPVAITFCPLCGSAIVFNRTLPNKTVSTFGVSGSLLESNMIMFDRATENLWQQSTGKVLAGSFLGEELEIVQFQLLTMGVVKEKYLNAQVLSSDTGYDRDYQRNPYAGYEENDDFIFDPSSVDTTFPAKTITAVFKTESGTTVITPWLQLREAGSADVTEGSFTYILQTTSDGELTILDQDKVSYPFYFEMWFSAAVQHENPIIVKP